MLRTSLRASCLWIRCLEAIYQVIRLADNGKRKYKGIYENEMLNQKLPVVVAGTDHSLRRIQMDLRYNDKCKHEKGIKYVQVMKPYDRILVLDNLSNHFKIYDSKGKVIQKVSPNVKNHSVETNIISICWSETEQRVGASLQDFSICFWDKEDGFKYEKLLDFPQDKMQLSIWYLEGAAMWITTDSCHIFHSLDIVNDKMEDFVKRHEEKITDLCEVSCMKLFIAASLDKKLIFWDPFKRVDLKIFMIAPVSIHSLFFVQNFNILVTGAYENNITVWKLDPGLELMQITKLEGHNSQVTTVYVL